MQSCRQTPRMALQRSAVAVNPHTTQGVPALRHRESSPLQQLGAGSYGPCCGGAEPRDPRPTANQYRHLSEAVCYKDCALWTPLVGDTLRGVPGADWLVTKLKRRPGDLGCNDVISCGKLRTVGDARRRCMPRLLIAPLEGYLLWYHMSPK